MIGLDERKTSDRATAVNQTIEKEPLAQSTCGDEKEKMI